MGADTSSLRMWTSSGLGSDNGTVLNGWRSWRGDRGWLRRWLRRKEPAAPELPLSTFWTTHVEEKIILPCSLSHHWKHGPNGFSRHHIHFPETELKRLLARTALWYIQINTASNQIKHILFANKLDNVILFWDAIVLNVKFFQQGAVLLTRSNGDWIICTFCSANVWSWVLFFSN